MLATFAQLTQAQRRRIYEFITSLPVVRPFDAYEDMAREYGGEVYAGGKQHFSLWDDGQVVGTAGVITREIPDRAEAFINAVYIAPQRPASISRLLARVLPHLLPYRVEAVNLGLHKGCEHILPYIKEVGFSEAYKFLRMTLSEDGASAPADEGKIELQPLREDNSNSFREIHNAAFSKSPNGATLSKEQVQKMLDSSTRAGLCVHAGIPVGVFLIARENRTGRIEGVAIHPEYQGRGIGGLLVGQLVECLYEDGAREVQLEVADSNEAAVHLYRKCGFAQEEVLSRWFTLTPEKSADVHDC